ncbi:MAG: carbonic anhydrase family protein, partial [Candidatus Thiodiazotropha sp. 6PLUC9]
LEKAWAFMPEEAGKKNQLSVPVDAARLMSTNRDYYRFNGSLTTPPCTEGVEWYVMKSIQSVSKQQLDKFVEIMAHDNNRPIQPLNARIVVE